MKRMSVFAVFIVMLALTGPAMAATAPGTAPAPSAVPAAAPTAAVTSAVPATAPDAAAADVIKNFYTQLADTMKQGQTLGYAGRFKKLAPVVESSFNLPLMTRFAVGSVWTKATPAEQQELIGAFSDFSVANYASQFKTYDGERFNITGTKPVSGGIMVETTLAPKNGSPVTLNYMMRKDEQGNYRIVDVYLDGSISQLAMRRSEFSSIVNSDGIPALVNSLDAKSKQMGPS